MNIVLKRNFFTWSVLDVKTLQLRKIGMFSLNRAVNASPDDFENIEDMQYGRVLIGRLGKGKLYESKKGVVWFYDLAGKLKVWCQGVLYGNCGKNDIVPYMDDAGTIYLKNIFNGECKVLKLREGKRIRKRDLCRYVSIIHAPLVTVEL